MKLVALALAWSLVPTAAGCAGPRAAILDVTLEHAAQLPRAPATDPLVRVRGPSSVYVIQADRVRAIIEWPRAAQGTVSVPLRAIDDGSGPIFVGVRDGTITTIDAPLNASYCMICDPSNEVRCCPKVDPGPKPIPTPDPTPGPDPAP